MQCMYFCVTVHRYSANKNVAWLFYEPYPLCYPLIAVHRAQGLTLPAVVVHCEDMKKPGN